MSTPAPRSFDRVDRRQHVSTGYAGGRADLEVRARAFPLGREITLEQLQLDPHPVLATLRASEPVSWLPALGGWIVTRRDLALDAMRNAASFTVQDERFSTGRVVGSSMLTLDGQEHDRQRAPFARRFRRDAVRASFSAPVREAALRLLDALAPAGEAELRRCYAGPLAAAIVAHALGLPSTDTASVLGWYDDIVASVTAVTSGHAPTAAGGAAFSALRQAIEPGLVAQLVDAGGELLPGEAVSNAAVLLFGGIETTEGMIVNAIMHLLAHPDQLEAVRTDPTLLGGAIEESLRLEPAAAVIDRYATTDVSFGGAHIRAGELVSISVAGANRDPEVFARPDRFDIWRPNARLHLAFAHGPHVCLGMHLARLEAHTAVALLLERLPHLRPDPERPAKPRGLLFRKPPELWVRWP
jgi:cytochrome P450